MADSGAESRKKRMIPDHLVEPERKAVFKGWWPISKR